MTDLDREFNAMCDKVARPRWDPGASRDRSVASVYVDGKRYDVSSFLLEFNHDGPKIRFDPTQHLARLDRIRRMLDDLTPDPDPLQDPQR